MDGVLPFEYGFLYKMIQSPNHNELATGIKVDGTYSSWYSSGGSGMNGYNNSQGIDHTKYFHPVGYISSKQIIVVEVVMIEKETINGLLEMNGMSFSKTSIEKNYRVITRAHIEANMFIRNFEKVL